MDLPEVPAGTCGNQVIEVGEDCDGFPDPAHDAPRLTCTQCRYVCDPQAAAIACPAGWGCGVDGRCRHAVGGFEPATAEPELFPTDALVAGDRDGDVAMELLGGGDGHVGTITAANRQLEYTLVNTTGSSVLAAADLDGDGVIEVLRPSFGGGVAGSAGVRGGSATTMLALGTFDVDPTISGEQPAPAFTTLVSVRQDDGSTVPYAVLPQPAGLAWLDLSRVVRVAPSDTGIQGNASGLVMATGNIDSALLKRGEEIAVGFLGETALYVRRPDFDALVTITLPAALAAAPIFGDVDGDGFVDLLAPVVGGAAAAVALGDGATLASSATLAATFAGATPPTCGVGTSATVGAVPRLIADLGGNDTVDFVTREGIILRLPNGTFCRAFFANLSSASSAVALDANGDGRLDVAIASGIDTTVTLAVSQPAIGQGGVSFEAHAIDVSDIPVALHAGAFDWDGFDDLLVVGAPDNGVSHIRIAKGTNIAASQVVLRAPDAPGLAAISSGPYGIGADGIADLVMVGAEPGRDAPYLAEVRLVGDGTEFLSDVDGPASGKVIAISIGAVVGASGRNDMVAIVDTAGPESSVWVFPDQGSYLTDRGAYEAAVVTLENGAPPTLADLDGDDVDELVLAGGQGLAIYDLVTPSRPPLRIPAPAATTLGTVRRAGGDCLLITSELTGATLECNLHGVPTSVALTADPVFGAVIENIDADSALEAVLVLGATLASYDLDPVSPQNAWTLGTPRTAARVCDGDFDGDGVGDFALTSDATVELWWGIPHDQERP